MRVHPLFAIPLFAIVTSNAGCGDSDTSTPPNPAEAPLSLSIGASALALDQSLEATVTLSEPAADDGAEIALTNGDEPSLEIPLTITIAPGDNTATFTLTNHYGGRPKEVQIKATYKTAAVTASLFVPAEPPEPPACRTHPCTR